MRSYLFLLLTASLVCLAAATQGQIRVNTTNTFQTLPPVTEWSTFSVAGGSANPLNAATLDGYVQTNEAANINLSLFATSFAAPSQLGIGYWTSAGSGYLVTRPANNSYTIVMATLRNTTASNISTLGIVFDQTLPSPLISEDPGLAGFRPFYSLTGTAQTWQLIPSLQSSTAGQLSAVLYLGTWTPNSLLYILFVDDNASGPTDGSFAIDNFGVIGDVAGPTITRQPAGTNVIITERVELSVAASGLGLSYQWFRDSVPLAVGVNPTANRATLIITNAQFADSGQYHVVVANAVSGVTSAVVVVNVAPDTTPPRMLHFSQVGSTGSVGTNRFRLVVTEPLCFDPTFTGQCHGDANAAFQFSWLVGEVDGPPPSFPETITENGTNYDFGVSFAINPKSKYYLTPDPTGPGIIDRFGNLMTNLPPATGFQSITSSPVLIFNTDIADAEIHSQAGADTALGAATSVSVDNDDTGVAQALLRFNNLIGPGANQIPQGVIIINATLTLLQADPGSPANFNRMLVDWDQATVTWNSLINGVTADGVEAVVASDGISVNEVPNGPMSIDVTPGVQAWANGAANYGWAVLSTGTGGWDWTTVESGVATAPSLSVTYTVPPCTSAPSFTVHPGNVTVTEGNSFTLTASLAGACDASYQWSRNNVDILGATGSSYEAVAVPGVSGNGGAYRLRVSNQNGSVTSNPGTVTANPDLTPPVITRAISSADGTTVTLRFSKQLNAAGNYTFDPEVADVIANLSNGANNATVTVTSAARTLTTPYRLTVADTRDNRVSQNLISPNPAVVDLTGVTPVLGWADVGHWNYATNDQAANPNWKTGTLGPEWLVGQQFFGFEPTAAVTNGLPIQPNPIKTPLQANDTNVMGFGNSEIFVSQYFHRQVALPTLESNTMFALSFYVDDGAIFYLDGVEISRYQMPAGPATFTTRSTGGNGEAVLQTLLFSASAGVHTLAVEVHQAGVSSSDVVFGLEINKVTLPSTLAIEHSQGTNIVWWSADSGWGLSSSLTVNGNYSPVAGNPLRIFRVPPAAQTTGTFYRLQYRP